jgi:LPXTG-site transpeptidase (sortase) family protein
VVSERRLLTAVALLVLVLLLIGGGVWASGQRSREGHAPPPEPQPIISPDSYLTFPGVPNGAPTSAGHDGLRIKLPELSIDLPIVDGDGFNAPLGKAAHYPGLAWPGEGKRTVIYAHARPGMFGLLFKAKVGQEVQIWTPQGEARRYAIREYYARWPISDVRWLQKSDHEELVLVTCTSYNYNDPRIVAIAQPV